MVNCALKTFKFFVFIINFLIFCLSVAVAAAAGVFLSKVRISNGLTEAVESIPQGSLYVLIGVGVVAVVISFLGCCGAAQESPCMLYTYGSILFILLIAEVAAGIFIFAFTKNLGVEVHKGLIEARNKYTNDSKNYKPIEDIQHSFACCGVDGLQDWDEFKQGHDGRYPDSCCSKNAVDMCTDNSEDLQKKPCFPIIKDVFNSVANIAGYVAILVAVIQMAAVVGTCCLAKAFKREYEVV